MGRGFIIKLLPERTLLQGGGSGRINQSGAGINRALSAGRTAIRKLSPESNPAPGVTTYIDRVGRGSDTDKNQGIRYGLQATIPHGTNLVAIHDTTFEYVAYPAPADFCRLSDFDATTITQTQSYRKQNFDEISADVPYLFVDINYCLILR